MKNNLLMNLLKGVLVLIIIPICVWYWTSERVDLRYTLSDTIPTSLSGAQSRESIQQIEIKNNGTTAAQNIVVKIDGELTSYQLVKYSQYDKIEEFNNKDNFELRYSELPPESNIKLIIKTVGGGINNSNLSISHSKGKAKEALSSTPSSSSFLIILFYLVFFGLMLWGLREGSVNHLKFQAGYHAEKILRRHRPFYIGQKSWELVRKEATDSLLNDHMWLSYVKDIQNNSCYRILSTRLDYLSDEEWSKISEIGNKKLEEQLSKMAELYLNSKSEIISFLKIERPQFYDESRFLGPREKVIKKLIEEKISFPESKDIARLEAYLLLTSPQPGYFNNHEWEAAIKLAEKYLETKISTCIGSATLHNINDVELLLKMEKPVNMTVESWSSLKDNLNRKYLNIRKEQLFTFRTPSEFIKAYKLRPDGIMEKTWKDYEDKLLRTFQEFIKLNMMSCTDKIQYINETNLSILDTMDQEAIKNEAYDLQLKNISNLQNLQNAKEFLENEKPSWIKDKDYNELKSIATGVVKLNENICEYDQKLKLIESLVSSTGLDKNKPESADEEFWKRIFTINQFVQENLLKSKTLIPLANRVERQLYRPPTT